MLELKSFRKFLGKDKDEVRSPFFDFLSAAGIPEEELARQLQAGNRTPFLLEPFFLGRIGRQNWFEGLRMHYHCDPFDLEAADLSPHIALVIPKELGMSQRVCCVDIDERGLTLGMVDPNDLAAVQAVEAHTDFKVTNRVAVLASDLGEFQQMLYGSARLLSVSPRDVVDQLICRAIEQDASDIHIEPLEDQLQIRFRKDGILLDSIDAAEFAPKKVLLRHLKAAMPVVIKNKSGASGKTMNIAETQKAQDGRIYLPSRNIDMRVSILPTGHGESVVIRIHRPQEEEGLEKLGFRPELLERFEHLIRAPHGILLVSGPTGSGKTTTLYTVLRRLNSPEKKLLTIEDPVEYNIPGVIQVQTCQAKSLGFASALRNFLRHDPDIIMVGEIRDAETAVMAVEASLTGHLVLTTVHANDAVRTLTRLKDLGVNPKLVASTCLGTMAQRLLRVNCPDCCEGYQPSDRFLKLAEEYGFDISQATFKKGKGCPTCSGTGFRGRTAIHELMVMTPELRELVERQAGDAEIERVAREQGMTLLLEDAIREVAEGRTTDEEVFRVTTG